MGRKKNKHSHLKSGYNRRQNIKLGFDTKKEYIDYCKHLVEVYENNEEMTINSLCRYAKTEHDIDLYYEKARAILHKFNADVRPPAGSYTKKITKTLTVKFKSDDVDFLNQLKKSYGRYMRYEVIDFVFSILRGRATKHMVLWLGEYKPVMFIWDKKHLKYLAFGEGLSKLESKILEELMVVVEDEHSLEPVKKYAKEKHLLFWGNNE